MKYRMRRVKRTCSRNVNVMRDNEVSLKLEHVDEVIKDLPNNKYSLESAVGAEIHKCEEKIKSG